jgi:hypothetical protein
MSRNFVSSIERGAHGVDVVRLLRLAVALDLALNDLLPRVEERPGAGRAERPVAQSA